MKKAVLILAVFILILLGIYFTTDSNLDTRVEEDKLSVVTTLYPLYDFAKNVGGDLISADLLLPYGMSPHSFEPSPSDIIQINNSDLFVYTGDFLEPWISDVLKGTNPELFVLNASEGVSLIYEEEVEDSHDHEGGVDPHIWLDLDNAILMVSSIRDSLIEVDSENKNVYEENAELYINKLLNLKASYDDILGSCVGTDFIHGGHYAFGYISEKYDLHYTAAQGFSADSEPSAEDIVHLIEEIREDGVDYIFYEELVTPRLAETLALETGVEILKLNPIGNMPKQDAEAGKDYISIMKDNLESFSTGFSCVK